MSTPAAVSFDLPTSAAAFPDLCAATATYGGRPEYVRQARADVHLAAAARPVPVRR